MGRLVWGWSGYFGSHTCTSVRRFRSYFCAALVITPWHTNGPEPVIEIQPKGVSRTPILAWLEVIWPRSVGFLWLNASGATFYRGWGIFAPVLCVLGTPDLTFGNSNFPPRNRGLAKRCWSDLHRGLHPGSQRSPPLPSELEAESRPSILPVFDIEPPLGEDGESRSGTSYHSDTSPTPG